MAKTEINICLGSSCFARGNKKLVNIIKTYLREHKLEDKVYFHGNHCFGMCDKGPILQINDTIYENVNLTNIFEILVKNFEK